MKIDVATPEQVREVALRMRERDFLEFSAVAPVATRPALAELLAARYGGRRDVLCASLDGEPIVIGGAIEVRPNALALLCYGTDAFPRIGLPLTRFIKHRLLPPLVAAGVHRIEAVSLEGYEDVHRWLRTLGLRREFEAPMRRYGKHGEDFAQFAWVRP